jgi:hypothetical protein
MPTCFKNAKIIKKYYFAKISYANEKKLNFKLLATLSHLHQKKSVPEP